MYRVPYGRTNLGFELPPGMRGTVVGSKKVPPIADVGAAIALALAKPVNSPPLRELARPGDTACIVFTDITRTSPDHLLVPALLAELATAGVRDEDITLLCGIGMHRCQEGAGEEVGEQRFFEKMRDARDMPSLLTELCRTGYLRRAASFRHGESAGGGAGSHRG